MRMSEDAKAYLTSHTALKDRERSTCILSGSLKINVEYLGKFKAVSTLGKLGLLSKRSTCFRQVVGNICNLFHVFVRSGSQATV